MDTRDPDRGGHDAWHDGAAGARARAGLRLALFGGSFNPAHGGHRHVALTALRALELDGVIWLVAAQNPLKQRSDMAPFADRWASAVTQARHPRMWVSNAEQRWGAVYSIDSIRAWQQRFPTAQFVWLMGADSLIGFAQWQAWRQIAHMIPMAIVPRPKARITHAKAAHQLSASRVPFARRLDIFHNPLPAWVVLEAEWDARSATSLRAQGAWPQRVP